MSKKINSVVAEVRQMRDHNLSDNRDYSQRWYWRLVIDGKVALRSTKSWSSEKEAKEAIRSLKKAGFLGAGVEVA